MAPRRIREQVLQEAWIGDAVLCLYTRKKILQEDGAIDASKAERMSSNQFLTSRGEPSEVEAEIGRVYESQGLDAAFRWIEDHLMPLYERQQAKRLRRQ